MKAIKCPWCGSSVDLKGVFAKLGSQGGSARAARQTQEQRSATARAGARATNELLAKRRAARIKVVCIACDYSVMADASVPREQRKPYKPCPTHGLAYMRQAANK